MEAPEEEDAGPSGLGFFFEHSKGATGGGDDGSGPQRVGDVAHWRRQAEALAEQGMFV